MKNNILPVLIIATAIMVLTAVFLRHMMVNSKHYEGDMEPPKIEHAIYVTPVEDEPYEEVVTQDMKKLFDDASYVTVELVERTIIEDENGNSNTKYDRYVISDVDLKKDTDDTEDFSGSLADGLFDEEGSQRISFMDGFGVTYKELSGWQLYESLLKEHGFEGDLKDVTYDSDTNKITGQNIYRFNQDCSAVNKLLSGEIYDEILDSKVTYQMAEDGMHNMVPDCFNAEVIYRYDKWKITKNLYLQVAINYWGEEDTNVEI